MPNEQEKNKLIDESMQRAYKKVAGEMPDVKPVSVSPGTGILSKLFLPRSAQAVTNPFTGNITYDPAAMAGIDPNEMENTLAHELTHVRQTQNMPWYKVLGSMISPVESTPDIASGSMNSPYAWRPSEMEAFQSERDRTLSHHLPNMRDPQTGMGDIQLVRPRKKSAVDTAQVRSGETHDQYWDRILGIKRDAQGNITETGKHGKVQ